MLTAALLVLLEVHVTASVPPPLLCHVAEVTLTVSVAAAELVELIEVVAVELTDVVDEGFGCETGGQDAILKVVTLVCGIGLRGPQILPSSSGPSPCVRCWKPEKSLGIGPRPGTASSGWIHSVTGCTYCPALIPFKVVDTPLAAVSRFSLVFLVFVGCFLWLLFLFRTSTAL